MCCLADYSGCEFYWDTYEVSLFDFAAYGVYYDSTDSTWSMIDLEYTYLGLIDIEDYYEEYGYYWGDGFDWRDYYECVQECETSGDCTAEDCYYDQSYYSYYGEEWENLWEAFEWYYNAGDVFDQYDQYTKYVEELGFQADFMTQFATDFSGLTGYDTQVKLVGPMKSQLYRTLEYIELDSTDLTDYDILGTMAVGDWSFYEYYLDQLAQVADANSLPTYASGYHGWPGEDANCELDSDG